MKNCASALLLESVLSLFFLVKTMNDQENIFDEYSY